MRVLVVTEIRLYRDGLADALRRAEGVEDVTTAASGPLAVVTARRSGCDVVLLDVAMSGSTETIRAVIAACPHTRVVALGVLDGDARVVECAEAGIAGYVSRDATLESLLDDLRSVVRGEAACSGRMAASLISHIAFQARTRAGAEVPQLTGREHEVLRLLQNGMSNKDIASSLGLQTSTVKNHVHNVLVKLGASRRSEILQYAAQPGELRPQESAFS